MEGLESGVNVVFNTTRPVLVTGWLYGFGISSRIYVNGPSGNWSSIIGYDGGAIETPFSIVIPINGSLRLENVASLTKVYYIAL